MVTYTTFLGQQINLGKLSIEHHVVVLKVLALAEAHKGDPFEFSTRCRHYFRRTYVRADIYNSVLRGPVGDIYRDCFYRIYAANLKNRKPQEFLQSIQTNPFRLLLDRYLDGTWRHLSEFAEEAGLAESRVTEIFKCILDDVGIGEISVQKLGEAFKALGIVPVIADTLAHSLDAEQFAVVPNVPTAREWLLILLVSSITRRLQENAGLPDSTAVTNSRDILAHYLGFMFGIKDYNHLDDFVYRVLQEIMIVQPELPAITDAELLGMAMDPDESSFRLVTPPVSPPESDPAFPMGSPEDVENLFVADPDLTEDERRALLNVVNSPWGLAVKDAWVQSLVRAKKWANSPLARSGLEQFFKSVNK